MKHLLKFWIYLKIKYAKKQGWIRGSLFEKVFLKNKQVEDVYNLRYIPDRLGKLLWDYQYDAIETFKRGGGDCNSINRVWQIWTAINKHTDNVFLVTFLHKSFDKKSYNKYLSKQKIKPSILTWILNKLGVLSAHTGCVFYDNKNYYVMDYGQTIKADNYLDAVKKLANKYRCQLKCYIAQDLNFNFVEFRA